MAKAKWDRELIEYISKVSFREQFFCQPLPLADTTYLKSRYRSNPCKEVSLSRLPTLDLGTYSSDGIPAIYAFYDACPVCAGTGKKNEEECWHCGGEGTDPNPD